MSEEMKRPDLEVLWTVEQVAHYFHIRKSTVYQWLSEGKMIDPNKVVYVGKLVRIPRSEVERIAGQKRERVIKTPSVAIKKVDPTPVTTLPVAPVQANPAQPVAAVPVKAIPIT